MKSRLALLAAGIVMVASASVRTQLGGSVYTRYEMDEMMSSFMLMGAEANVQAQVSSETRDIFTAAIQLSAGTSMPGWTSGFHFGEAYVLVPTALGWPTFKVGQAPVPFGLLADYDIHRQIVQTSYARVLGLRLDPGAGLLGTLGPAAYRLWVSNGNGPFATDGDKDKLVTMRIAPTFLLGNADLAVGLSVLAGKLPYWSLDSPDNTMAGPQTSAMKYRLGLDNTTTWGPAVFRLEAVAGRDSSLSSANAFGYYAEARYAVFDWLEPLAKYDGWHTQEGSARNLSVGLTVRPEQVSLLELEAVYQLDFLNTRTRNERNWSAAVQLAASF